MGKAIKQMQDCLMVTNGKEMNYSNLVNGIVKEYDEGNISKSTLSLLLSLLLSAYVSTTINYRICAQLSKIDYQIKKQLNG